MLKLLAGNKKNVLNTLANRVTVTVGAVFLCVAFSGSPVLAEKIENDIAVFAALDKVTARISSLEVRLGETKVFGALKITPRVCYSRPPTEPPQTSSFVEVQEIKLDGSEKRLFSGWMFAQSPGLSGVEHPVFDVWLTNCKMDEGGVSDDNAEKSDLQDNARSNNR